MGRNHAPEALGGDPVTISKAGLARIKRYEACSLTVYDDQAGLPTIGWGHLIKPGEFASDARLTQDEADALFLADLAPVEAAVNHALTVDVTQEQYDSLVSITFNIGEGGLYQSTFLRLVNMRADPAAIRDAIGRWCKVTNPRTGLKEVSAGLAKRRADEAKAWPDHQ